MTTFSFRRIRNLIILAFVGGIFCVAYQLLKISLQPVNYYTGWCLLIFMLFLALYNVRKKIPFLSYVLGRSATWLQFHLYVGLLTVLIFVLHVNFRIPNGTLEIILTVLFFLVILSGIFGIFITRRFPVLLTLRGEPILFERLSVFRKMLREEVEKTVFESIKETKATTISEFYVKKLLPFFHGHRNFFYHLMDSKKPYQVMMNELEVMERYIGADEQKVLSEIRELVRKKDDVDYQYTLQLTLKGWLFFHIPITYSLMIFSFVHGVLAYAYFGGIK